MQHFRLGWVGILGLVLPLGAFADITNQSVTLAVNTALAMDTGVTGSSGDILFTGTSITVQGTATIYSFGATGQSEYGMLTQSILTSLYGVNGLFNKVPLSGTALAMNEVFAVHTAGGNLAKAVITLLSSTSATIEFTTYGGSSTGGGPTPPSITSVLNNSSLIPPGFPNSGLAPSSLFHVFGANMATPGTTPVLQDSTKGLPLTLNGTSLSVTVSGTTVQPALYYSSPTDVAAVLPAKTPTGNGTLTVSYGNLSATVNIQVVPTAFGFDLYNGAAVATDGVTGALITYTNSAKPTETLLFWGTGIGADPNHSDTVGGANDSINMPVTFYIGGVQVPPANVTFTGALFYPGVQGFAVTIPQGVPNGCFVPIVAVTGSGASPVVSSTPTLPIMNNGGVCTDAFFGISGSTIGTLSSQNTVKSGDVFLGQLVSGTKTTNIASAIFESDPGSTYAGSGGLASAGCILSQTVADLDTTNTPAPTPLDAGSLSVTGPAGNYPLMSVLKGTYVAQLPAGAIASTGGAFVFTGTGGADVGAFTATVNLPNPLLNWTDQSAAATITRSQGLATTWTGGASGTYVFITGSSSGANGASASFFCYAPQNALGFTVPAYITSALPSGTGTVTLENLSNYFQFSAPGLDYGYGFGFTATMVQATYQ